MTRPVLVHPVTLQVITAVRQHPGATVAEIQAATGLSTTVVVNALMRLATKAVVRREHGGPIYCGRPTTTWYPNDTTPIRMAGDEELVLPPPTPAAPPPPAPRTIVVWGVEYEVVWNGGPLRGLCEMPSSLNGFH